MNSFFSILMVKKILRNWKQWTTKHREKRLGYASDENSILDLDAECFALPSAPVNRTNIEEIKILDYERI